MRPLPRTSRRKKISERPLPPPTDPATALPRDPSRLDALLADVLTRTETVQDGIRALYGPASGVSLPSVHVWTDGSCIDNGTSRARAGAGVYFGANCARNVAARVPGRQTNNRGEHLSVILALLATQPHAPLVIYTDSELVIHTYCHWARRIEQEGWNCANSDLVQYGVALLRDRPAPASFRWVKGHSGDAGNEHADLLAKQGAA
ncbi:ribonuclease H-like domain-containing protein, partial [Schizophyllum commune]